MKRQLITTSLPETWPTNNQPILILGEWCRKYKYKDIFDNYDAHKIPYHWDDRKKLRKDYDNLTNLNEVLLRELKDSLNYIHNENHNLIYYISTFDLEYL